MEKTNCEKNINLPQSKFYNNDNVYTASQQKYCDEWEIANGFELNI